MTPPKRLCGIGTKQVREITGCTLSQLRYWDEIGLVHPGVQAPGGHMGIERIYRLEEVVALLGIQSLRQAGWTLQRIGRVLRSVAPIHSRARKIMDTGAARAMVQANANGATTNRETLEAGSRQWCRALDALVQQSNGHFS